MNNHIFSHQTKKAHKEAIVNMIESYGYTLANGKQYNKINRMNKRTLQELYNLIRYGGTNSDHLGNDLYLCYGLLIEKQ